MKYLLLSIVIGLSGCQSAAAPGVLPAPASLVATLPPQPIAPPAAPAAATAGLEQQLRRQAQYIEALISQNDALAARLTGTNSATPPPTVIPLAADPPPLPRPAPVVPALPPELTLLPLRVAGGQ